MFVDLSERKTLRAFQGKSSAKQYQFELGTMMHNRQSNGFKQRAEAFSCLWGVPCIDSATESILVCLQRLPIRICEAHPDCCLVAILQTASLTGYVDWAALCIVCVCAFVSFCVCVCQCLSSIHNLPDPSRCVSGG